MDATDTPLLTMRRKRRLGVLAERWVIYDGDAAADAEETSTTTSKPLLSVRSHRASSKMKALAYVTPQLASSSSSQAAVPPPGPRHRMWWTARTGSGPAPCGTRAGTSWWPRSAES